MGMAPSSEAWIIAASMQTGLHLVAGPAIDRVCKISNDDVKTLLGGLQLSSGIIVHHFQTWVGVGLLVCRQVLSAKITDHLPSQAYVRAQGFHYIAKTSGMQPSSTWTSCKNGKHDKHDIHSAEHIALCDGRNEASALLTSLEPASVVE